MVVKVLNQIWSSDLDLVGDWQLQKGTYRDQGDLVSECSLPSLHNPELPTFDGGGQL